MLIEKVNNSKPNKIILNHAVEILKRGGVLVIPTETAYGLAADATNKKAVKKIYKIKGRNFKKFLPLICSSINQIQKYFKVGEKELELLRRYKGLTVVLSLKHKNIKTLKQNIYLLPRQNTCAVRVSTSKVANLLVKRLGRPITATSANLSGGENCYSVEEVSNNFRPLLRGLKQDAPKGAMNLIDLILDAGKLKKRKPSTIVKVEGNDIKLLRQGEIKINKSKYQPACHRYAQALAGR